MRCLTLWQPWASLIAEGLKTIETRGRPLARPGSLVGERLAIHAGLQSDDLPGVITDLEMIGDRWQGEQGEAARRAVEFLAGRHAALPKGAVLCVVVVTGERSLNLNDTPRALCLAEGRWGYGVKLARKFAVPVQARGFQGIWNWDEPEDLSAVRPSGPQGGLFD